MSISYCKWLTLNAIDYIILQSTALYLIQLESTVFLSNQLYSSSKYLNLTKFCISLTSSFCTQYCSSLQITTIFTLPMFAHYHFMLTIILCTLSFYAHYRFLHTSAFHTVTLIAQCHFSRTTALCVLPLFAQYCYLHSTTHCIVPLFENYYVSSYHNFPTITFCK